MTKTTIGCDDVAEEKTTRAYLTRLGAQVGPTEIVDDFSIYEVDGVPPDAFHRHLFPARKEPPAGHRPRVVKTMRASSKVF